MGTDELYFVKASDASDSAYQDMTVMWPGLTIQKITGFLSRGTPKNIYTESWVNSNQDDIIKPDTVFYETGDIEITFFVSDFDNHEVNVMNTHDAFINYMTSQEVSIWSKYVGYANNFIFLSSYEPSSYKVGRPKGANFVQGTLKLHQLNSINERKL